MYNKKTVFLIKKQVITMRTKHVLMAMMLPAVFAACTSDEFVEPTQGDLNGRKLINGLTVNVEQDAETRFQWSETGYKWAFETGDKFGAAVTDPTTFGTVVNSHMLGNYIFERQANGGYETNSRMVEGTYLFYSYPGFENKASRDLVKFSLGTQKADLSNPEAVINENQLFFSPLYKITAENANMALPLTFQPYWSVAAFKIKNNTGAAFKISQIALKEENVGYKFVTDGEIDPTALNSAKLVYSVPEGGDAYSLPSDMNASKYEDAMATTDLAKSGTTKKENVTIVLNCGNYELANGAEVVAYMSVPAGNHAQLTAEIIVSANGVSKAIKVTESETTGDPSTTKSIACTGINTLQFKRGYTKPVFGIETDGKTMKALVVAANNLQDANGFYVDNKTDLLNVVNANRGDIEIYNSGDLYIDNDIINAIALYTAGKVEFANPIAIKAEGDTQLEVKQMTFNGVTVESGNVKFVEALTGELVVNGGKVTLANDADEVTVNGGELVVAKTAAVINEIDVQNGTLTLNGENQTIGASNIKDLTFGAATGKVIAFNLAMSGNSATKTLTVSQGVTLSAITTTTVNANNKITVSASTTLTNNGVIENNGEIDATSATSFTNSGEIENAKVIKNLTNSGYVKQTDGWFSSISLKDDSNGLIDNTVGGTITKTSASDKIYRIYTGTNPSTTGLKTGEIAVMKDVTFTQDITLSNKVLFFGETEITSGTVTCNTGAVIGVTNDYKDLAAYVLNKTWDVPATNTVNAYNATVGVYVYEGATLEIKTSYETGTGVITLMNKGTVDLPSSNSGNTNDWTPVTATANN